MNCHQIREHLTIFLLGELEYKQHLEIETHLERCIGCSEEATQLRRDLSRISSALKTELSPPPAMLERMRNRLAPPPKRRFRWWIGVPAFALATSVAAVLLFGKHVEVPPLGAFALADAPFPSTLMGGSPQRVAQQLQQQTGVQVALLAKGEFKGGGCVTLGKAEVPVLVYDVDGKRVQCYEVKAGALDTTGMRAMSMGGRRFFCCSRGGGSLVAIMDAKRTLLFSCPVDEKRLVMIAMRQAS